jgi:Zn-dependent M16 (insulinase) family peptidase
LGWYLKGLTDEDRQRIREEVLETGSADIRALADAFASVAENGRVVVMGFEEAIAAANAERGGDWLTISKVL